MPPKYNDKTPLDPQSRRRLRNQNRRLSPDALMAALDEPVKTNEKASPKEESPGIPIEALDPVDSSELDAKEAPPEKHPFFKKKNKETPPPSGGGGDTPDGGDSGDDNLPFKDPGPQPPENKTKKLLSFKNKNWWQRILYVLVILFAVGLMTGIGIFIYEYIATPKLDTDNFNFVQNSKVMDVNGEFYQDFQASENREVVSLSKVPDHVQKAFIAIEDERFYSHGGVDIQGLARAVLGIVVSGSLDGPGGSTITQQLIKLTHLTSDKTVSRKIQEMILATRLEKTFSKDQILEAYLNKINLSQAWGVQAAAHTYFNKDVSELSVAQAAMLAAMPKSPAYYDPYVFVKDADGNTVISVEADGRYTLSDDNKTRAIIILDKMLELSYIDQAKHDEAVTQLNNNDVGLTYVEREIEYSYFTDSVYGQIIKDLVAQKGMTEEEASEYLLNGGLTIYSTVDPAVQAAMEEAASRDDLFPSQSSSAAAASAAKSADTGEAVDYTPQVGMTVIDNNTGNVAGIVGGREKKTNLSLNRATQKFQPGSSTKPLTTYGPGLDTGKVTLGTVFNDVGISYEGWTPQNAEGNFLGLTTVRQGLVTSRNTIAVQTCIATGLETCAEYAEKVGLSINRTDSLDVNPASLALGGYSEGQTTLAMASAYSSFVNNGVHKSSSFYTKVVDAKGKTVLENKTTETQVYKPQTAYLITDVLKQVVNGGTASIYISGQPVAGKTGTTDEERHAWLCGYTPYYSMAVWYGYDENTVVTSEGTYNLNIGLIGGSKPGPAAMFETVMNAINADKESADFPANPGGISTASIDNCSGKLATSLSSAAGSAINEMFIDGTVPTESDNSHTQAQICSVSGAIANEYCPAETVTTGTFLTTPGSFFPSGISPTNGVIGNNDTAKMGPDAADVCTVHTAATAAAGTDIALNMGGQTLGNGTVTMAAGSSQTLTVNGPNNTSTTFTSSNGGVATVSGSGTSATVTAVGAGSTTITVTQTITAGGNTTTYTKNFSVTVN